MALQDMPESSVNHRRDIVVIGASAGGVEALMQITAKLPERLRAAVFVVLHLHPDTPSLLPRLLSRVGPIPAAQPADGERIRCGRIYVAPPDHHLLVERGFVKLSQGPTENASRPAIDPLSAMAWTSASPWNSPGMRSALMPYRASLSAVPVPTQHR